MMIPEPYGSSTVFGISLCVGFVVWMTILFGGMEWWSRRDPWFAPLSVFIFGPLGLLALVLCVYLGSYLQ